MPEKIRTHIEMLADLLEGLNERLIGTVVDEHLHIPRERVPEIRRRTTMLEIDEPNLPEAAVAAGISRVEIAREILQKALDEDLTILLD